jgi:hypothetical protein
LLPAPVWYRFFLNKEYGGLFSSLTTGLYLTFKVASMVEKVRLVSSSPVSFLKRCWADNVVDITAASYTGSITFGFGECPVSEGLALWFACNN